jgi:hypothetical protein
LFCKHYELADQNFSDMLQRLSYLPKENEAFVLIVKYLIFLAVAKYLQKKEDERETFQNQIEKLFVRDQYFRRRLAIETVLPSTILNLLKNFGYVEPRLPFLKAAIMRALSFNDNFLLASICWRCTPSTYHVT